MSLRAKPMIQVRMTGGVDCAGLRQWLCKQKHKMSKGWFLAQNNRVFITLELP